MARFYVSDALKAEANHWHGEDYWQILDATTEEPAKATRFFSEEAARQEAARMSDPHEQERYDRFMARGMSLGADFHWRKP